MSIFLHTLRVLNPAPAGRIPLSSHPSGVQSHRFAPGSSLANIKEIKGFCRGDLQVGA